jgi:hypothetical protein
MPSTDDSAAFRRWATKVYQATLIGLAILALACIVLGYWIGGIWGLILGAVIGAALAFGGAVALTLLYAMSQDSA